MKKTYMNPTLLVVKIQTHQMLAASGGIGDGEGKPGQGYDGGDVSYGRDSYFDEDEY